MIAHPQRPIEPHVLHTSRLPEEPPPVTEAALSAYNIKRAALAYVAGYDSRSIREIARAIGAKKSALSKAIELVRRKTGVRCKNNWFDDALSRQKKKGGAT